MHCIVRFIICDIEQYTLNTIIWLLPQRLFLINPAMDVTSLAGTVLYGDGPA